MACAAWVPLRLRLVNLFYSMKVPLKSKEIRTLVRYNNHTTWDISCLIAGIWQQCIQNENWFVILLSHVHFGDWVTEIWHFSLLKTNNRAQLRTLSIYLQKIDFFSWIEQSWMSFLCSCTFYNSLCFLTDP